jgi:hypothetical protein
MALRVDYERHGRTYAQHRRPDPRIAARIHAALGDARTVLNVGAGTGSYEPSDRWVLAVEPSATMACVTIHHCPGRADAHRAHPDVERRVVDRLAAALESGAWDAEHGHLRERESYDGALRLVISEKGAVG